MLTTNQKIYTSVMNIEESNWAAFFDSNKVYELMYKLQIVEAVIEEGDNQDQTRVRVIDVIKCPKKVAKEVKKLPQAKSIIEKDDKLKKVWTSQFLEKGGFRYMMETFMDFQVDEDSFKLMYASFMLKLLRFFMLMLISTTETSEVTTLLRRKSSHADGDNSTPMEIDDAAGEKDNQLKQVISGALGLELLEGLDYPQL